LKVSASFATSEAEDMEPYFSGEKLYGDNFSPEMIECWFQDEELGYYQLGSQDRSNYRYGYHALNEFHGFRHLPLSKFRNVLGIGSAYAEEFRPLLTRISRITVLEPASGFESSHIGETPIEYVRPNVSGKFPFPSDHFDLVTCLGVLHHIANVSEIVQEIYRCTAKGGYILLREPIISMGDWRKPRRGLTKRERGIPLALFREMIHSVGFEIVREAKCFFPVTPRLRYIMRSPVFNSRSCVLFDALVCSIPWPARYHATSFFRKFRPWAIYYVLYKREN
jgi:SAM-dependent methyltransferase